MSSIIISPNMSLPVPVPGQEFGPQWATDLNNSLSIIDGHTHAPGSGVQVTPAGLNINADLSFNGNNAISLRTTRFVSQLAPISSVNPDIGELYVSTGELYYNDLAGNAVQITTAGSVNAGAGSIGGLPSGTASANYSSGTFVFQQATSTAANIDAATLIVRYPGSYPSPAGNFIAIEAPSSLSSAYAITLPSLPASTRVLSITNTGILGTGVSNIIQGSEIVNASITGTQIAAATIGSGNLQANLNFTGIPTSNTNRPLLISFSSTEILAVMRGVITSVGSIASGAGFTCTHVGTGVYTVSFTATFGDLPAVTVTPFSGGPNVVAATVNALTSGAFTVSIGLGGSALDSNFSFTAIGARNP